MIFDDLCLSLHQSFIVYLMIEQKETHAIFIRFVLRESIFLKFTYFFLTSKVFLSLFILSSILKLLIC